MGWVKDDNKWYSGEIVSRSGSPVAQRGYGRKYSINTFYNGRFHAFRKRLPSVHCESFRMHSTHPNCPAKIKALLQGQEAQPLQSGCNTGQPPRYNSNPPRYNQHGYTTPCPNGYV